MADIDFLKRRYYVSALGLTEAQAVRMTINDLEYAFFSTASPTISGTGSPEGVVTAAVGTYYTDTAITNGAMRWAKKTGAGNTGWKVVDGDTGKRWITATMLSGWTCAWANIVRKNDVVEVIVSGLNGSAATDGYFMTLPAGFRDSGVNVAAATSGIATGTGFTSVSVVYSTGVCNAGAARPTSGQWRHIFTTADPWPTTLPGVAA